MWINPPLKIVPIQTLHVLLLVWIKTTNPSSEWNYMSVRCFLRSPTGTTTRTSDSSERTTNTLVSLCTWDLLNICSLVLWKLILVRLQPLSKVYSREVWALLLLEFIYLYFFYLVATNPVNSPSVMIMFERPLSPSAGLMWCHWSRLSWMESEQERKQAFQPEDQLWQQLVGCQRLEFTEFVSSIQREREPERPFL